MLWLQKSNNMKSHLTCGIIWQHLGASNKLSLSGCVSKLYAQACKLKDVGEGARVLATRLNVGRRAGKLFRIHHRIPLAAVWLKTECLSHSLNLLGTSGKYNTILHYIQTNISCRFPPTTPINSMMMMAMTHHQQHHRHRSTKESRTNIEASFLISLKYPRCQSPEWYLLSWWGPLRENNVCRQTAHQSKSATANQF